MTVLVLGGTRYMGTHLVRKLISDGHDVTIATRGNTKDAFGDKVKRIIVDRRDPAGLCEVFKGKQYDVTIDNLAYSSNEVKILLDVLDTKKYVMTSTCSVYADNFHENMHESEMDTAAIPLKWCNHDEFPYDEVKRQAEAALFQAFRGQQAVAVRFPFIFGKDDYTKRLYFYVEHILNERVMYIDNLSARLSFIESDEAGQFLSHVATEPVFGPINAGSHGTVSIEEMIDYVEKRTSKKAIIAASGAAAPFNETPSFSLDTAKAEQAGFKFRHINDWVYPLIDFWISEFKGGKA